MISLIQYFVADFLWKVSLKMLNSGIILKTFTQEYLAFCRNLISISEAVSCSSLGDIYMIIWQ